MIRADFPIRVDLSSGDILGGTPADERVLLPGIGAVHTAMVRPDGAVDLVLASGQVFTVYVDPDSRLVRHVERRPAGACRGDRR